MSDLVGNPEDWFSHDEAHIMAMQNAAIFTAVKNYIFLMKNCDIFLIFAQSIDPVYMLELPS